MEQKEQNMGHLMGQNEESSRWREDYPQERGRSVFETVKSSVSDQLSNAAQKLHEQVAKSGEQSELSNVGSRVADWLDRSAGYVKDLEPKQLRSDIEAQVRRNPGRSLLIAGIVGVVLGRIIRSR